MKIAPLQAQKLFVPGIFALVLGLGNIYVGYERQDAYYESLQELEAVEPLPDVANSSPLMRMQFTRLSEEKALQRQNTARARVEFYQLVVLGGKALCLLALVLFALGAFASTSQQTTDEPEPTQP